MFRNLAGPGLERLVVKIPGAQIGLSLAVLHIRGRVLGEELDLRGAGRKPVMLESAGSTTSVLRAGCWPSCVLCIARTTPIGSWTPI